MNNKNKNKVLTIDKFLSDAKLYAKFYEKLNIKMGEDHDFAVCNGNHIHCSEILTKMGMSKKDIKDVISYLMDRGGYCDCEVMFNCLTL